MTTVRDRRQNPRIEKSIPAEVRFLTPSITTQTANVSSDGLYFVATGALTVEVVLHEGGRTRKVTGRLVRVESRTANHDELGFAVRLDPAP